MSALAHARKLHAQGMVPEAGAAYFRLLEAHPEDPDLHFSMGQLALMANKADHAEFHFRRALAAAPGMAQGWGCLGVAMDLLGQPADALESFRKGVQLDPEDAGLRVKLAIALRHLSRLDEALVEVDRVLQSHPDHPDALIQRGEMLKEQGRWSESDEAFRMAVQRNPGHPHARYQWACVQLSQGLFKDGWAGYEARLMGAVNPAFSLADRAPNWDGRLRPGTSLMIRLEQGLGDTLQFIRYLPRLLEADMELVIQRPLSSQNPVLPLLLGQDWSLSIVGPSEDPGPVSYQANLLSLPHLTGLGPESMARPPYLKAPERYRQKWKRRLDSLPGMKVGVVWQGNKLHPNDGSRSVDPVQFSRLLGIDGIRFISLQKDRSAPPLADAQGRMSDWMEEAEDLADTAAIIDGLDAVVSVDTSVAHLAGALGKPVYLLLPHSAEWRWLRTGERTPWYPGHRLLRQSRPGDWEGVVTDLERHLRDWAASQPS
ncbi:MAG: tetratricopeptide repeat protein [Holophagaceae bacterium]|nr:tetratricopeptide repeat protein [Holophagaceae bacterium]